MLGSQIIDVGSTFSGRDFNASEIHAFGYSGFERAVSTSDTWASHPGPEIVLFLQGEACWDNGSDMIVCASGGQAIFFPSGVPHRVADGIYPPCESLWFVLNAPGSDREPRLFTEEDDEHFYSALPRVVTKRELTPEFMRSAIQFARAIQSPSARSGSRLVMADLRSRLYALMVEVWRIGETHDEREKQSLLVSEAAAILRQRVSENVNVGDIATELGYSRGHLHTAFRREMGMTPSDYQRRLRLRICCDRLVDSRDSVTEIAHSLGFSSSQHLSKVFRAYHGVTPSDYRKQHQSPAA
jgi:AraC-like DNA-binding protein